MKYQFNFFRPLCFIITKKIYNYHLVCWTDLNWNHRPTLHHGNRRTTSTLPMTRSTLTPHHELDVIHPEMEFKTLAKSCTIEQNRLNCHITQNGEAFMNFVRLIYLLEKVKLILAKICLQFSSWQNEYSEDLNNRLVILEYEWWKLVC